MTGCGAQSLAPLGSEHVAAAGLGGVRADTAREDVLVDVIAAALARDQITLVDQMLVGEHHRVTRHAELLGELSARGNSATRKNVAAEDGAHHHLPELALQAGAAFRGKVEELFAHGLVSSGPPIWH